MTDVAVNVGVYGSRIWVRDDVGVFVGDCGSNLRLQCDSKCVTIFFLLDSASNGGIQEISMMLFVLSVTRLFHDRNLLLEILVVDINLKQFRHLLAVGRYNVHVGHAGRHQTAHTLGKVHLLYFRLLIAPP